MANLTVLESNEIDQVSGGLNPIGAAIGGGIGLVGGFFYGVGRAAFGSNTASLGSTLGSIAASGLSGAVTGATIGSGAGIAASIGSAIGSQIASDIVVEATTTDE